MPITHDWGMALEERTWSHLEDVSVLCGGLTETILYQTLWHVTPSPSSEANIATRWSITGAQVVQLLKKIEKNTQ